MTEFSITVALSFLVTALTYISVTYVFVHFILLNDGKKDHKKYHKSSSTASTTASLIPNDLSALPGPTPLPVIGNLAQIADPMHATFNRMSEQYGPIFQVRMGTKIWVILNDHEIAKSLFVDRDHIYVPRRRHSPTSGKKISLSKNDKCTRQLRSTFKQTLSLKFIEHNYLPVIHRNAMDFVIQLHSNSPGVIDPSMNIEEFVIKAFSEVTYGGNANAYWEEINDILGKLQVIENVNNHSNAFPWPRNLVTVNRFESEVRGLALKFEEISRKLCSELSGDNSGCLVGQIFKQTRSTRPANGQQKRDKETALLDEQELNDLLRVILLNITTDAVTEMRWIYVLLAYLPQVRRKIKEELKRVVNVGASPTPSDYEKLPYLRATIMEALRFRPVRFFTQPYETIKGDTYEGYRIPANATVILNTNPIHFSAKLFERPKRFVPERWLDQNGRLRQNTLEFDVLAFGKSPEETVGRHLIEMTLCSLTAYTLSFFDIEPEIDPETGDPMEVDMKGESCGLGLWASEYKVRFLPRRDVDHVNILGSC